MTQCVSVYSCFTAKLKSGPRRQLGPRRSPERFWCFHRVIGPIQLYGNTDLGRSWVKTGYVAHGHFCCTHRYTRTRVASRLGPPDSRAIQLYSNTALYSAIHSGTALYIIQLYIAIHYRTSTTPLCRRAYMCMHMLCMHMSRICQRGVVGTPPQPLRNAGRQPMAWLGSCTHSLKDGGDQVMRD